MNKFNLTNTTLFLAFLLLTIACNNDPGVSSRVEKLPYYQDASFTPHWEEGEMVPENFHRISSFQLVNQNGVKITEDSLKHKISVVDFFFTTCPGICPKMTKNMFYVQDAFLKDEEVLIVSHSVTPEKDSVPILKRYAEDKGIIDDKWHLLTGERSTIYRLGRRDYFVEEDLGLEKTEDEFIHTENFILIDKNLHIRGIYNGLNKTSVNQLIADIHTLKKE